MSKPPSSGSLVYPTDAGCVCPACRAPVGSCKCATSKPPATLSDVARIRREVGGRGGKTVTVVTGLPLDEAALAALSKRLKSCAAPAAP